MANERSESASDHKERYIKTIIITESSKQQRGAKPEVTYSFKWDPNYDQYLDNQPLTDKRAWRQPQTEPESAWYNRFAFPHTQIFFSDQINFHSATQWIVRGKVHSGKYAPLCW